VKLVFRKASELFGDNFVGNLSILCLTSSPCLKQGDSNQAHAEACTLLMVGSCFIGWLTPYSPQAKTASPTANMFLAAFIPAFSLNKIYVELNIIT